MTSPQGPRHPPAYQLWNWAHRPFEYMEDLERRFGETFRLHFAGIRPFVLFSNPEHIREIFSADPEELYAGESNAVMKPFLGAHSLLMLDGAEHLRQRRLVLGPLHGERMQQYGEQMAQLTHEAIDRWPLGTPFPIHPSFQATTLGIILRTVFGFDTGERLDAFSEAVTDFIDSGSTPALLFRPLRVDLGRWSPWGRFRRAVERVDTLFYAEIHRRRAEGVGRRADVLSLLMEARDEAGTPLSDVELRDQLLTLLITGHETTATALAWFWHWVLKDEALHTALREEARAATSPAERGARLPLLEATLRETLRLQPVIPTLGRVLQRPMRIGGYDLPAGTRIMASIYLTHRRPSLYPEPERFLPQRFLDVRPSPWEWIPFGGGTRRCVGMAFALYEMKVVLATILSRTLLRRPPGPPVKVVRRGITLSTSQGMPVLLEERRAGAEVGT